MEYKCFDVLEIHGQKYAIVEKLFYREKGEADRWQEYGLKPAKGSGKWHLTVAEGGASCTLSQTVSRAKPPQGFRLRGKGVQVVTRTEGTTDASVGDVADYLEYANEKGDFRFFIETWRSDEDTPHAGQRFCASGMRIPPADIRLCSDAASLSMGRGLRKEWHKELLQKGVLYAAGGLFLLVFALWPDGGSWHDVRAELGFPYTMEEHLADSDSYDEAKEAGAAGLAAYESRRDPATVAMELIEAIGGNVVSVVQDKGGEDARILIRTREEICLIHEVDGKTRVEVGAPGALSTAAEGTRYDVVEQTSRLLERYARQVRTGDTQGRKALLTEERSQKSAPNRSSE